MDQAKKKRQPSGEKAGAWNECPGPTTSVTVRVRTPIVKRIQRMNTQHAADKALLGMAALGQALLSVATAGTPNSGPDIVDQQRQQFDGHIQEARAQFAEYFAELISTHPVTPDREQQEAAARVPQAPVAHDEAKHHSFLGIPID